MTLATTAQSGQRGALLIDADNFHDPDQLRAIYSQFVQHVGKNPICHVHGAAKMIHGDGLKAVWQTLGAKLLPCLPLNKNTTDATLVVDALLLHFQYGVRRFGIASGDADFAPLSLALRELGCEVTCYARMSIAFEAMVSYYDRVVRFDTPPLPPPPSSVAASPVATTIKFDAPAAPIAATPTKAPTVAQSVPAPMGVGASEPTTTDRDAVRKILAALPKWIPHTVRQLNQLGTMLRAGGIKVGNAPLHQMFRKYPLFFTVLPRTGPAKQVRLDRMP